MSRLILTLTVVATSTFQAANAQDFSNVKSGLLLGIYASPSHQGGMRVSGLIPGYSAEGRLFPGDVLMRATIDGHQVYNLRTTYEMENAKMAIGANQQAALEIWRPSQGMIYAWVEFTPINGPTATYTVNGGGAAKAQFRMESEKPGARQLFQRGGQGQGSHNPFRQGNGAQPSHGSHSQSSHGAARLFK